MCYDIQVIRSVCLHIVCISLAVDTLKRWQFEAALTNETKMLEEDDDLVEAVAASDDEVNIENYNLLSALYGINYCLSIYTEHLEHRN